MGKILLEIDDNLHYQLRMLALKRKTTLKDLIIKTLEREVKTG